jgi:uncharacterized protein with HEPN domain
MSRDKQSLLDYLDHIAHAGEKIQKYTADMTENIFLKTDWAQDAVVRNFEIIGEASRNIEKHYPVFVDQHPELPLRDAYKLRNAVSHGYFDVDLSIVWRALSNELPDFLMKTNSLRADQSLLSLMTENPQLMIEQAKSGLANSGLSQEFQDAVIKQMHERLESTEGLKINTPDVDERER